jgi:hypothetical protein
MRWVVLGIGVPLVCASTVCARETSFLTWRQTPYGVQAQSLDAADFDGDGLADLAVLNGNLVEVLLADGHGNFSPPLLHWRGGAGGRRLLAGDYDGDGGADIAVLYGEGSLALLFGDGTGAFPRQHTVSIDGSPTSITAADIDGDGDRDFLVSLAGGSLYGFVQFVRNGGAGTFVVAGAPVPAGFAPTRIASGDFDNDGHADAAVINESVRTASVLFGDGAGGFGDLVTVQPAPESTTPGPDALEAGDVTGDGIDDLVVGNGLFDVIELPETVGASGQRGLLYRSTDTYASYGHVALFAGTGERRFNSPLALPADNAPIDLRLVDIDGDHHRDIVSGGAYSGLVMLRARSEATFDRLGIGGVVGALATGDFNGDGRPDIAVAGRYPRADILLGLGGGRFPERYSLRVRRANPRDPAFQSGQAGAADVNGDGLTDLVVPTGRQGTIFAFLGRGDGDFGLPTVSQVGHTATGIATADFTGDGIVDVMTTGLFDGWTRLVLLAGDGRGQFAQTIVLGGERSFYGPRMAVTDVDRNGTPDLVAVVSSSARQLVGAEVFLSDGRGGFPRAIELGTGGSAKLVVGDINADENPDVVLIDTTLRSEQAVFLGRGDGTFTTDGPQPVPLPNSDLLDAAGGDFNEDGLLDLVVSVGGTPPHIGTFWMQGDGNGDFVDPVHLSPEFVTNGTTATFVGVLSVADFNGDGHHDIAVAVADGVSIFEGDGRGHFTPFSTAFAISCGGCPLLAADLNGDGLTDLATQWAPLQDLHIDLLFNETAPEMVVAGDANCDGAVDQADVSDSLRRLFSELWRPGCKGVDVNDDGMVTAADLVRRRILP